MKARAAGTNAGASTRSDEFSTIDSAIARRTSSSSRESSADASSGALRALRPWCLHICARRLLPLQVLALVPQNRVRIAAHQR